ncbi:MAG: 1-deoxy-D-xylulose-5-phosphate reductoisomerase [Planctomycetota bacterium]
MHQQSSRRVCVLGATGSVGLATLEVVQHLNRVDAERDWQVWAMSGHRNLDQLCESAAAMHGPPPRIIASEPSVAGSLRDRLPDLAIEFGSEALIEAAEHPDVDTVVAAIVGRAGLESTLAAVNAGKRVGLANKETLVVAGPLVTAAADSGGAEILPIDSEHSAIFQCLAEARCSTDGVQPPLRRWPGVRRLILTASGGPFRDSSPEQMDAATPAEALNHPTWNMGPKITIDSATMMNKALEVIEARWLFDVPADRIEVIVHPQSLIHSMVEFDDGSLVAQISPPDMRLPIQYALTYPCRLPCPAPSLDRREPWQMSMQPVDLDRFPALSLGFEVARVGGTAGAVVNGANESAVALFLDGKIRFTDIPKICRQTLLDHHHETSPTLSTLLKLDRWSRQHAHDLAITNS